MTGMDGGLVDKEKPGYYAVIPADIRYDDRIPANAKLLYGEISALIGRDGFCFAQNSYFAELYKVSERTITGWIKVLKDRGYISVYLERDKSGQILSRKIYLRVSVPEEHPVENIFYTSRKNFQEGIEKNCGDINLNITNIDIKEKNKKEKKDRAPKEDFDPLPLFVGWIGDTFRGSVGADGLNALYLAVVRFLENREALKKPIRSKAAVTALCNKLMKLAKDDPGLMIELLDTATVNGWQSVYAPKDGLAGKPAREERTYQCV